jgi:hypothetical protein
MPTVNIWLWSAYRRRWYLASVEVDLPLALSIRRACHDRGECSALEYNNAKG